MMMLVRHIVRTLALPPSYPEQTTNLILKQLVIASDGGLIPSTRPLRRNGDGGGRGRGLSRLRVGGQEGAAGQPGVGSSRL
jgi:hypothetical protein